MPMSAQEKMAIHTQLATLKGDELRQTAMVALEKCDDLSCSQDILAAALARANALVPHDVGEGGRVAMATGSGALTGILRGLFGDLWGRVASLPVAGIGLGIGLASTNASRKAAGYAVLTGAAAGEAAIEARDIGEVIRAKMLTKVPPRQAPTTQPAPVGQ